MIWGRLNTQLTRKIFLSTSKVRYLSRLIIVEGNIGVGKTTLSRCFEDHKSKTNIKVFHEPAPNTHYLAKFYRDPLKYGLILQMILLKQRFALYVNALKHATTNGGLAVLDRSVFSDVIFANVVRQEGNITEQGYAYYSFVRNELLKLIPPPDAIIYLRASPEVCLERVKMRARDYENTLPLDYLQKLHTEHESFIENMRSSFGSTVLTYNWSFPLRMTEELPHIDEIVEDVVNIKHSQIEESKLSNNLLDPVATYDGIQRRATLLYGNLGNP